MKCGRIRTIDIFYENIYVFLFFKEHKTNTSHLWIFCKEGTYNCQNKNNVQVRHTRYNNHNQSKTLKIFGTNYLK